MRNSVVLLKRSPVPKGPKPPRRLLPEARRWWRELQAEYGIRDSAGLLLLQTAAEAFAAMRAAEQLVAAEGLVVTDRFGQKKAHPATTVARDARLAMLRCLKELCLDLEPLERVPGRPAGRIGG